MKSYKIKKRSERFIPYIANEPITHFIKPKIPHRFFKKVHKPNFFRKQEFIFEEQQERREQQGQQGLERQL
jgi:hypothetical protein